MILPHALGMQQAMPATLRHARRVYRLQDSPVSAPPHALDSLKKTTLAG